MQTEPAMKPNKRFEITLAGETNLDLILYGLPQDMPVERELLATDFAMTLGGSSSILAHNLAKLGSRVGFATQLGGDELGAIALERLRQAGVDLTNVTCRAGKSSGITLLLPHGQSRHILTNLGVMAEMTVDDLDVAYLSDSSHFHLSSLYLQSGIQAGLPDLFLELKRRGLTLSLDTNDDPNDRWDGVLDQLLSRIDVFLPNEDEIKRITGRPTLDGALDALRDRVPVVVVKCGSRGAVVQQGTSRIWIDPVTVLPIDTIGAGDSFNAGFLYLYARRVDPITCARMGVITGALSTLRPGGTEAFRDTQLCSEFLPALESLLP